jgi:hypothetical protein
VRTSGRRDAKEKGEGRQIWWMYFAFMYENRAMKPAEIPLRRGQRRMNLI